MKRINRSLGTEVTDDNKASSNCWIACNYCVTSAVPCFISRYMFMFPCLYVCTGTTIIPVSVLDAVSNCCPPYFFFEI